MTDQDYFPQRSPRGETRADAVKRINEERGLYENAKAVETPEMIEAKRKAEAEYLAKHDAYFRRPAHVSVGDDPEARDD